MANTLYDKARESFLKGELDWETQNFKVILVDTGAYTPSFTAHTALADVAPGSRITPGVALTAKTATNGAADANDVTFSAVSGVNAEALIIYLESGDSNEANMKLIAYIDSATGLPITPNGGDIIVVWDNGTNKIFRL